MGMSLITALEIFSNAYDLEIVIAKEAEGKQYTICISRGPGHNFKSMLSSAPFSEDLEKVIGAIKNTLEAAYAAANAEFAKPDGLLGSILDVDHKNILTPTLIAWICQELRTKQIASTYKIQSTESKPA
jgi:hypothetical protein